MRRVPGLVTVAAALACGVWHSCETQAFDSVLNGVHERITRRAASSSGLSDGALKRLVQSGDALDYRETSIPSLKPNSKYRPEHHFDRNVGDTNKDAFLRGAQYVREERDNAINLARTGRPAEESLAALGRALHALQDFFSHSNYVDLAATDQKTCTDTLWDATKSPPDSLRLTGYDKSSGKDIKDDAYGHSKFAKDNSRKNAESRSKLADGRTRFQAAQEAAVAHSAELLQYVRTALGEDSWKRLASYKR